MKLSPNVQNSLNRVIEKFKKGDLSPISEVIKLPLDMNAPSFKWSLCNKVLAYAQCGELDCRGFYQWKTVGRFIKKGSKAVYIVNPIIKKSIYKDEGKEYEDFECVGFGMVAVFPASATEGEKPIPSYVSANMPPLMDMVDRLGISVAYVPMAHCYGDCTTDGSRIRISSSYEAVFFHELAHAIHAKLKGGLLGGQHKDQETIAELTATVLMDFYGCPDHSGRAWKYISHYSKDPMEAILKAISTVEKVLKVIFIKNEQTKLYETTH